MHIFHLIFFHILILLINLSRNWSLFGSFKRKNNLPSFSLQENLQSVIGSIWIHQLSH